MSTPSTVCALPGCPNLISFPATYQRGYCNDHAGVAIVEEIQELGTRLDRVAELLERK